jgi:hypothetical protein
MFCPKCNQQQASETMRFCSRCGFPLAGVAMLLQNDGVAPELSSGQDRKRRSSRRTIMIESAVFTVICWIVGIFATFWFDSGGPFETIFKIAALLFSALSLIGVIRFLYGFIIAKDPPAPRTLSGATSRSNATLETPGHFALPAQHGPPITDYSQRGNTNEMVPRASITEHTTKLLDEHLADESE